MQNDIIDHTITPGHMQLLEIELDPGEVVVAEPGMMVYMSDGVEMRTGTGGSMMQGLKRAITGENFFVAQFGNHGNPHHEKGKAYVGFGGPHPGTIIPLNLEEYGGTFYCQRGAFICAARGTEVSVALTKKLGAGLFGGAGFILQKITGMGWAFLHAGGNMKEIELKAGEKLRVDVGSLMGYSQGVDFSIDFVGGMMNPIFGGEGVFHTTLTGPGKVWIQSMPIDRSVMNMLSTLPAKQRKILGL